MRITRFAPLCLLLFTLAVIAQNTPQQGQSSQASSTVAQDVSQSKAKKSTKEEVMEDGPVLGIPPTYTPPPVKTKVKPADVPPWLTEIVQKQFGKTFEIFPGDAQVLFTGDFDGDGVEDAVIVARSQHPLNGMIEFNYKAFSPEDEYYGWGDPAIMTSNETSMWQQQRILLVIHGAGPQAWRAEKPKAKYVIVNVPFQELLLTKMKWKKHVISAIAGSSITLNGVIYWDGRKYKYGPTGTVE